MISIRFNDEDFTAEFDRLEARLKRLAGLARVLVPPAVPSRRFRFGGPSRQNPGGRHRAKRGRLLTVPVSKEAYGRTAATLEHERGIRLFALGKRDGQRGVLAELSTNRGVVVHYVLRRSVEQKPDRTALPMKGVLLNALVIRARVILSG